MMLTLSEYLARLTDHATQYVLGGSSAERSLLDSWRVVFCLATVRQSVYADPENGRDHQACRRDCGWSQRRGAGGGIVRQVGGASDECVKKKTVCSRRTQRPIQNQTRKLRMTPTTTTTTDDGFAILPL